MNRNYQERVTRDAALIVPCMLWFELFCDEWRRDQNALSNWGQFEAFEDQS